MKTKNLTSESDGKIQHRDVDTPPRKKLKQARLPFQIFTPGVEPPAPPLKNNNKRKLESSDDIQIVKVIRPNESNQLETKEDVCSPSVPNDCKNSIVEMGVHVDLASKDVNGIDSTSNKSSEEEGNSSNIHKPDASNKLENKVEKNSEDSKLVECKENANDELESKFNSSSRQKLDVITINDESSSENVKDDTFSEKQKHSGKNETIGNQNEDTSLLTLHLTDSECSETEDCKEVSPSKVTNLEDQTNGVNKNSDAEKSKSRTDDLPPPESIELDALPSETVKSDQTVSDTDKTPISQVSHKVSFSDAHFLESTPKCESTTEKVSPNSSLDSARKSRKLTPRQLLKQLDSAKRREEKEREKQERERKRAEEKEEREKKKAEEKEEKLRQKQEKEEQKKKEKEEKEEQKRKEKEEKEEQKRKEKEEREEQKKKEKEEKERKKQIELEMKNEEKRKKEDKRQAEVAAFTSFFVPKKAEPKQVEEPKPKAEENFMPFEVKADMRLAPSKRTTLTAELRQALDKALEVQNQWKLYLEQLKNKEITPQSTTTTWAFSDFKNEVVILEDDEISDNVADSVIESYPAAGQTYRPKLLQFWENRRPPYWGTWRKKSKSITPIKPLNRDEKYFDYEVHSDDEWEEEEPGESLHGSDDEKESEDEYEVDNEFFVPHGYLSEEENEGEEDEVQSPERMKTKLKLLELEFEEEMKQKTERLKPRIIGCIWVNPSNTDAGGQLSTLMSHYKAVYQDGPILTCAPDCETASGSPDSKHNLSSQAALASKRKKFPEEGIPALIRLIHGNINRREYLIKEFIAYWCKEQEKQQGDKTEKESETNTPGDIVKRSVSVKIKELATWVACPDEGPMYGRMCWYVPSETREAYGLSELTLPNTSWTYTIKPKRRESDIPATCISPVSNAESMPKQLITKFTKVMTEVERKKQFTPKLSEGAETKSGESSSAHPKSQKKLFMNSFVKGNSSSSMEHQKKVPVVTSVSRGQDVPKCGNSLMKFIKPQAGDSKGMKNVHKTVDNNDKGNEKVKDADCLEYIVLD